MEKGIATRRSIVYRQPKLVLARFIFKNHGVSEDAASALLRLSAVMDLPEFGRKLVNTILRDAVWLLLLCRESCDAS